MAVSITVSDLAVLFEPQDSRPTVIFVIRHSLSCCRALSPVGRNLLYISQRYSVSSDHVFNSNVFGIVKSYILLLLTSYSYLITKQSKNHKLQITNY